MTSLLETKLYMPLPASDFVLRGGLYERLDQGLHRKLTLMSAAAGFGKSTTAVMWLQHLVSTGPSSNIRVQVAWYTLDEHDNDLHSFVRYLVAAVRGADINLLEGWIDLDSRPTAPSPEEIAAELLARLATETQHRQSKVVITLDDYHHISSEEVHCFVAYLLRRLPATIHVVILTRFDPPLGLPQLRVRGEVSDIRAGQLAFTREEADRFLHRSVAADMDAQAIDALWKQTEGWAAGLRLAAISLQGTDDRDGFILRFAQSNSRHVADYLAEEVLSRQSPTYIFSYCAPPYSSECATTYALRSRAVCTTTANRCWPILNAAGSFYCRWTNSANGIDTTGSFAPCSATGCTARFRQRRSKACTVRPHGG